ncbi:MAG: restriction endonuclease subunit S [Ignavibacteriae bacterium]|nr:restriction endonuclease subunit S [Ignavibacteriota bacterium]
MLPQLRFPEFVDNWGNDKFENLTKINQGLQIPISERHSEQIEGSYFYITNEFLKKNSDKRYYILNPTESVLCDEGDVLMTRTGNTGQVVTNVVGAFHNNFFKIKFDNEQINKDFLVYFLRLYKTQNAILRLAGTSTIPDLNHSDFYRIEMPHPTPPEQTKIANFLTAVDKRINLLQKKKAELEQYKKGVMQKLFSQTIRFKKDDGSDFTDWEEKTLGDLGDTFNGLTGKTKVDFRKGKPYIQYMQIFSDSKINTSKFGLVNIEEGENQNSAQYGDVFFTTSSETSNEIGTSSVLTEQVEEVYLNSFCFGYRPNSLDELVPEFSQFFFRSDKVRKEIVKLAQGSTRFNMSKVELMKLKFDFPKKNEQQKIANFLTSIDKSIEKLGNQIDDSVVFKQGLLQKMFV